MAAVAERLSKKELAKAAEREYAARILGARSFMPFVKRMNPRYKDGWVHRDIAERLEKFSKDVAEGKSPRLMILMPPRHGKSELASRLFPAWHLGQYPDHEFIACSYNSELAMSFSRKVQQALDDPAYQSVFSTRLDPGNTSVSSWGVVTSDGKQAAGAYLPAGVGGPITGRGAHILVIDDPVKNAEEADSQDQREKVWEWYLSTAYSRLAPGGGVLIIQTWWHDDDLAGRLQQVMAAARKAYDDALEGGDADEIADAKEDLDSTDMFEIVKYPAIAIDDEWLDEETREIVPECPVHKRGGRLLRRRGEALHPQRYDLRKLKRIRQQNRRSDGQDGRWWSALYQQNPVPSDGDYFTKDLFRVGALPRIHECHVYQTWDFAISEKKANDWTVGVTVYLDQDDVAWVVEVKRFKSNDTYRIVNEILDMAKRHDHQSITLGLEDGQIYKTMAPVLAKRMAERVKTKESPRYLAVEPLKPLTDKSVRARPLQARMQQGKWGFLAKAGWYDAARSEMLRFPAGAHDDQVDAQAWAAQMLVGKIAPRRPDKKKLKSWMDQLSEQDFGDTTAMAA